MAKKRRRSLAASNAERWVNCPGSVELATHCPKPKQDEFGREGTQAHQLADECIANNRHTDFYVNKKIEEFVFGEPTDEMFLVTQEMAEAVQFYVDYFNQQIEGLHSSNFKTEIKTTLKQIGGQDGLVDGLVMKPFDTLEIIDYKHGAGHLVDPENNYQLLCYALGVMLAQDDYGYEKCRITVVQPRSFDSDEIIKTWEFPYSDLEEIWLPFFKKAIAKTKDSTETVQGDWCKYCPCKAFNCPTYKEETLPVLAASKIDITNIPIEKVAEVMINEDRIKDFLKACKARVELEMIDFKMAVPGFKVVKRKKTKKWDNEYEANSELLEKYDESVLFNKKFKTPTQMIKTLGMAEVEPYLAEYVEEYTVAKISDRRKEVDLDE